MTAVEEDALLREALVRGDHDRAADRAIRLYGPELVGWLRTLLRVEADAYDAFSLTCERLWKSLASFEGRCTVRVWSYMIARQCASHIRARPSRSREELVSSVSSSAQVAEDVWGTTRREQAREDDVFAEIRDALDEESRTLLVLRVDRGMPWREIAIVLLGDADDDAITRKAATLRKQFERVKEQLRGLAADKLHA